MVLFFIGWLQLEVFVAKMPPPQGYENMSPMILDLCRTKQKLHGKVTAENKSELHCLEKINYVIIG